MQALDSCDNKLLKVAFHLSFTATLRLGELLGLCGYIRGGDCRKQGLHRYK